VLLSFGRVFKHHHTYCHSAGYFYIVIYILSFCRISILHHHTYCHYAGYPIYIIIRIVIMQDIQFTSSYVLSFCRISILSSGQTLKHHSGGRIKHHPGGHKVRPYGGGGGASTTNDLRCGHGLISMKLFCVSNIQNIIFNTLNCRLRQLIRNMRQGR